MSTIDSIRPDTHSLLAWWADWRVRATLTVAALVAATLDLVRWLRHGGMWFLVTATASFAVAAVLVALTQQSWSRRDTRK